MPTQYEIERAVLYALHRGGISTNIGSGYEGIIENVIKQNSDMDTGRKNEVAEAIWSLLAKGLVYFDFSRYPGSSHSGSPSENWNLMLTAQGTCAADRKEYNPNDKEDYFAQFVKDIPDIDDTLELYVKEALETYRRQCFLACAVMLGVAAESALWDMGIAFSRFLGASKNKNLNKLLENQRTNFSKLLNEIHRLLNENKASLPDYLKDGLSIQVSAIADLVRNYRNDAGHPSGSKVSQETCLASLVVFPSAVRRMYELKKHFEASQSIS